MIQVQIVVHLPEQTKKQAKGRVEVNCLKREDATPVEWEFAQFIEAIVDQEMENLKKNGVIKGMNKTWIKEKETQQREP